MTVLRQRWLRLLLVVAVAAVLAAPVRIPYCVLILAAAALVVTLAEARSLAPLGLSRRPLRTTLLWGVGLAIVAAGLIGEVIEPAIERALGTPADYSGYGDLAGNLPAVAHMWGYAMLSAAVGEEVVARGFLLHQLGGIVERSAAGRWTAILLSAAVFALAHAKQGTVGVIATGLIGILFAWAWFRTGRNLWALMLAHGLTDTYGVAMLYWGRFG